MIEQMRLRNLGVIAEATMPIGPGFTAVTGETGAGKTMVVTGLGLLLGARADSGAVRQGAGQAEVEGVWVIPATGAVAERVAEAGGALEPIDDVTAELVLARNLSAEGRSRASVGGRTAPAAVLTELADDLVVVHGQADQLRLRTGAAQREALDRFGGEPLAAALVDYRVEYERLAELDATIAELTEQATSRTEEARQLREAIAQIEQVAPSAGEDDELAARAERLANAEALREAAAAAREALSSENDAVDATLLIAEARRALDRVDDPALAAVSAELTDLSYRIADAAATLSGYLADLDDGGPRDLELVEERRAALADLSRVHGSLEAALHLLTSGSARLLELDDDPERLGRLTLERDQARTRLDAAAAALTKHRVAAAATLGGAVTAELRDLAMPEATLTVQVTPTQASAAGRDEVALLLAPHAGAVARPVAKSASGGELSRVMLAIEVVIASVDAVPTFVFDEVDAGIGGAAAIEVGRRLAALARHSQVIAVTHLAQVAAFAGNHLSVVKSSDGSVTASSVQALTGAAREAEMARLLSGMPDSPAALEHARELLHLADEGMS